MRRTAGYQNHGMYQSNEMLEEENEHLEDGLHAKVSKLKELTIDIGNEVRAQNKMLGEMDDDFDKSQGLLASTMGRLKRMAAAGHNRYILYLLLFSLFVFFVIWYIVKSK
ncbi:BET1 homolog [Ptychodera flava]|uniref:BET1 homolog n=1 Tax=Ptychodera flava TaxID=63121 RepID=UPI003969C96D